MTPTDELIAAPVGEWETTAEERARWSNAVERDIKARVGSAMDLFLAMVLRDFDRLSSALAAKDYLLRLCEEQHHRDEAALSAERDQNKRLVEALGAVGERYAHWPDGDPHAAVYQTIGDEILVALPPPSHSRRNRDE